MIVSLYKGPSDADWMRVKMAALVTVGKTPVKKPDAEWKHRMLVARHSPIRELTFTFMLEGVPYCNSVHLVRHHEGCQPYVRSQRNDRQDLYNRNTAPQDAPVDMMWTLNAEALMVIANKRLCTKADPETRRIVQEMCTLVLSEYPEFRGVLVPMCAYHGGKCHEMNGCGQRPYDGMGVYGYADA